MRALVATPLIAALLLAPALARADTLVASRTIRSQTLLQPGDLGLASGTVPGALTSADQAVGMEARVVLYAGRPIRPEDIGPAALIDRNQIVTILFRHGKLTIMAEGRSLGRGTAGDRIKVMNLASHSTISATIGPDGTVWADGGQGS